jgi:signal transduction histidine kinase
VSTTVASDPATRVARWPWVVLGLALVIASIGLILVSVNGRSLTGEVTNFAAFMGMGVVGALSLSRSPRNVIGLLMLWVTLSVGFAFAMTELSAYLYVRGDVGAAIWVGWPGSTLWALGLFPLLVLLPLLFPDGRLVSRRWRPVLRAGLAVSGLAFFVIGFASPTQVITIGGRDVELRNPLAIPGLERLGELGWILWPALLALFVVSAASMVVRFRRSRGVERQQLKWFAFAATVLLAYFLTSAVIEALEISEGTVGQVISGLAFAGLPVAVGVAILQYRLWDLDVVVKKTVVAGSLVLLAIAVYAGAVALIGLLAIDQDRPAVLFAIALGLGIAFRPAMRVGRRIADRLVYGRRATPYEVLTEFSERMGTSFATEDVLPRMAQVLGEGTGAETARVWLLAGGELHPAAAWPPDASPAEPVSLIGTGVDIPGEALTEVRDRGELLGALSVRMPASDPMSPSKDKLVRDLAAQAGMVLRNVRLVEDLRTSRQRLVAAQDAERRRLERNIHDGAQQQLVALAVKARLAGQLAERDPGKTAELLEQIEAETQSALEDLRDLARGIYPPLLADQGLVAALQAQSRKSHLGVEMDADGLGRFPADVEATVYFCTLEALQNIAKYAAAERTVIRLARSNGSLSFEVEDDGLGFDPTAVGNGSGLQGMADRLAAVGGSLEIRSAPGRGTTVAGHVPIHGDRRGSA